jgi:hypothetical protein
MKQKFRILLPLVATATLAMGIVGVGSAYASTPGHGSVVTYSETYTYPPTKTHNGYQLTDTIRCVNNNCKIIRQTSRVIPAR